MFTQLKNIDTAFRHIRSFSIALILANVLMFCYYVYRCDQRVERAEDRVLILLNGKVISAISSSRKENLPVEIRDHIRTFHELFFTLDPDEKMIQDHMQKAIYLADGSAKRELDNLRESGYFTGLVAGNISQEITVDSITLNLDSYPYYFKCDATQRLIRSTSVVTRSLLTEGYLRNVERSDYNPHGFLIEKWAVLENSDLNTQNR